LRIAVQEAAINKRNAAKEDRAAETSRKRKAVQEAAEVETRKCNADKENATAEQTRKRQVSQQVDELETKNRNAEKEIFQLKKDLADKSKIDLQQMEKGNKDFMRSMLDHNSTFMQDILKTVVATPSTLPSKQIISPLEDIEIEERKFELERKKFEFNQILEKQRRETLTWEVDHKAHHVMSSPQELAVESYHNRIIDIIQVHTKSLKSNTKVNQRLNKNH
jgi:hypothetical protein